MKLKFGDQAYRILRALLDAPGEVVTRDYLKETIWPDRKAADFDSGINKSISQIRTVLGDNGRNPRFVETLSKRGYRFIAPVVGGATHGYRRPHAIAVLPFENLTGDVSLAYVADGIAEALTTDLGGLEGIRVISRTSTKSCSTPGKSLAAVGRELRVNTVVEGSIQGSASLRVNVRLVDIDSDRVLWRGKYDCEADNLLMLCERLTEAVAAEIGTIRSRGVSRPHPAPRSAAYLTYLKGRYLWNKRTEKDLYGSIEEFKRALQIHADFALAHAGLADAYILLGIWGIEPPLVAFGKARQAAKRAIELDESLAEAHTCLAEVLKDYEWDWHGAENEFRRAITLNPNYSTAHHFYSQLLVSLGRFNEAAEQIELARHVDPLAPSINAYVPYIYLAARDYTRAVAEGQRAVELEPASPVARWQYGRALLFSGDVRRAVEELETASKLANRRTMWQAELCFAHARSGSRGSAEAILAEMTKLMEREYVSPYDLALCAAGLGDSASALDHLERAYCDHVMRMIAIGDPEFDGLRLEPRFIYLVRKLRLHPLGS